MLMANLIKLLPENGLKIIIKKKVYDDEVKIPILTQNDGEYIVVKVKNTEDGMEKGLTEIRKYAETNNLQLGDDLWQFNIGINIERLGLTKDSILAYIVKG